MSYKQQQIEQLKKRKFSLGILASNWLSFKDTLTILSKNNLNLLHFDIADGQFSSLFTTGAIAIKPFNSDFIKDVHLMVGSRLLSTVEACAEAGADIITLQVESGQDIDTAYRWLTDNKPDILQGISICSSSDITLLTPYLAQIDVVQILTLDPRTGYKLEKEILFERINAVIHLLGARRKEIILSVDGSMNLALATELRTLDIDWIVSGSAFFADNDLQKTIELWTNF
ncbi:ribulose phosphate epimerase [Glaesserella sp.]|uniref:ribulose phosphate epimerase n=1 Tax=Glaesserella sp. TaxID=2094731 RepID=UPI0035A0DBA9